MLPLLCKMSVLKVYSSDTAQCINIKCKHKCANDHWHDMNTLKMSTIPLRVNMQSNR